MFPTLAGPLANRLCQQMKMELKPRYLGGVI